MENELVYLTGKVLEGISLHNRIPADLTRYDAKNTGEYAAKVAIAAMKELRISEELRGQ